MESMPGDRRHRGDRPELDGDLAVDVEHSPIARDERALAVAGAARSVALHASEFGGSSASTPG
jgi:hypothetical protein